MIEKKHWQALQVNQLSKFGGNNSRKQIVLYVPGNTVFVN
jgi:hypothetical protein